MQDTPAGEVNWIMETKGRVWEGTAAKDQAMADWCARVTAQTQVAWRFVRIDQRRFGAARRGSLAELLRDLEPEARLPGM